MKDNHGSVRRVVYVLSKSRYFLEGPCGRVTHALGVIEGLARNGWRVDVLTGPGLDNFADMSDPQIWSYQVPLPKRNIGWGGEVRWRRRLLVELKDLIQGADMILFRYAISQPWFAFKLARLAGSHGTRSVLEVNSLGYHHLSRVPNPLRRALLRLEATVASQFNAVYAVSSTLRDDLVQAGCRALIKVIPNAGSDIGAAASQSDAARTNGTRIVYCGVFQRYYEFEVLLTAFGRLARMKSEVTLALYGHGDGLNPAKIRRSSDRIMLHGPYEREHLPRLLNAGRDILVIPYASTQLTRIGSPIKLFEYFALGVPVIASDVGQLGKIVDDGRTGYLYRAGSPDSLVRTLVRALENPEERREIARQALEEFRDKHTWVARMKAMDALSSSLDTFSGTDFQDRNDPVG